jgi:hypothetical protein
MVEKLERDGVEVYAYMGMVHASVCYPKDMPLDEVLEIANQLNPTGLDHEWEFSNERHFATGQPNPCRCDGDPKNKLHRLLVC